MVDMSKVAGVLMGMALLLALTCDAGDLPWYAGTSGALLLPGNGNSLRRAAEVSAHAGCYASEYLAWEVGGVCTPNISSHDGHGSLSGAFARGLYHLSGIEAFDKLFGCERFDPFVTFGGGARFGSRHVFAAESHRVAAGPVLGFGAYYHLTERLDLRFDAQSMLCCDSPCGMLYSAGVGLQWSFGGGGE